MTIKLKDEKGTTAQITPKSFYRDLDNQVILKVSAAQIGKFSKKFGDSESLTAYHNDQEIETNTLVIMGPDQGFAFPS